MSSPNRCRSASAGLLFVLAAPATFAQTLCSPNEQSLFSCEIGKKILSVCGSRDLDARQGVMQYRFGPPGGVELSHPDKPGHPSKHFTSNLIYSRLEQARISELTFRRGDTTYTVFSSNIRGKAEAGVTVDVKGKTTELRCKQIKGTTGFEEALQGLDLPNR